MREIKFRGKCKWENHPRYGEWIIAPDQIDISEFWKMVEQQDGIDPSTVGQFTGLKDSKGVEIYEGDVIVGRDADRCNSDLYEPTPVIWREGSFCCEYWHMPIDSRCEVCGNIHDKENNNDQS